MRLFTLLLAVLFAAAAVGCGGQKPAAPAKDTAAAPAFTRLLAVGNGDVVSVDPATVKSDGTVVTLMLQFAKKEIKNGVKSESWDASFKPSERLVAVKAKMLYDEAGKVVSADTVGGGWEYIAPESDTEKIMQAVVDHCKSRGLALNATPPPYALPGFKYLAKSTANNAHYLYKPSSVRAAGGQKSVEVLMINEAVDNGVKYTVSTVTFQPGAKKYQTTAQALYDAAGKKTPVQGDAKWHDVPPHSVYDMLMDEIK
jgi:hypothetical protein